MDYCHGISTKGFSKIKMLWAYHLMGIRYESSLAARVAGKLSVLSAFGSTLPVFCQDFFPLPLPFLDMATRQRNFKIMIFLPLPLFSVVCISICDIKSKLLCPRRRWKFTYFGIDALKLLCVPIVEKCSFF